MRGNKEKREKGGKGGKKGGKGEKINDLYLDPFKAFGYTREQHILGYYIIKTTLV